MAETMCPMCGTPVRVASGDEGTNHYEPLLDPLTRDLAEAVSEGLMTCCGEKSSGWCDWCQDALILEDRAREAGLLPEEGE